MLRGPFVKLLSKGGLSEKSTRRTNVTLKRMALYSPFNKDVFTPIWSALRGMGLSLSVRGSTLLIGIVFYIVALRSRIPERSLYRLVNFGMTSSAR